MSNNKVQEQISDAAQKQVQGFKDEDSGYLGFLAGAKYALANPSLMKDAMIECLKWVNEIYDTDPETTGLWSEIISGMGDEPITTNMVVEKYIEHLNKQQ